MATAAQITANQRNALKSTGPKTLGGKQMSSANNRREYYITKREPNVRARNRAHLPRT